MKLHKVKSGSGLSAGKMKKIYVMGGLLAMTTLSTQGVSFTAATLPSGSENDRITLAAGEPSASHAKKHGLAKRGKGHFRHHHSGHEHSGMESSYAGSSTSGNGTSGIRASGIGVSVPDAGGTLTLLGLAIGSLAWMRRRCSV